MNLKLTKTASCVYRQDEETSGIEEGLKIQMCSVGPQQGTKIEFLDWTCTCKVCVYDVGRALSI